MTITKTLCDACRKELSPDEIPMEQDKKFSLPIIVSTDEGKELRPTDVVLCTACANVISRAYYQLANEHGSSGLMGIVYSEDEE